MANDFKEIECKQCVKLLDEIGKLKRGQGILKTIIKNLVDEVQKLEEQLQNEVNYSETLTEAIKEMRGE
jgi:cell division protein FtsB